MSYCSREKTLTEEISELPIEESIKQRILTKIAKLEKNNEKFVDDLNKYYFRTTRMKRAIVMLSLMLADTDQSDMEKQL